MKLYLNELNLPCELKLVEEDTPLGTFGVLFLIKDKIKYENVLVTNCDTILDIDYFDLYAMHKKNKADGIISVCKVECPVEWCNTLPEDGSMKNFLSPDISSKRSQDLPERYRINGAIYIVKTNRFIKEKTFFITDNIYAYTMERSSSVDIDDEFDLQFAEFLLLRQKNALRS